MRHRGENKQSRQGRSSDESVRTRTDVMVIQQARPGKHRAPVAAPRIPTQARPTHDTDVAAPPPSATTPSATVIPDTARWRASHLPRTLAAIALALSALGTAALAVRYAQSGGWGDLVSLVAGVAVVVVLWAVVIASTPQVVTLRGSVLTVKNTSGSESFDLADALQPVDVVGNPRTSHWAVLLHRLNNSTVVLRRNDVVASELDPIVRHYRMVADQRHTERDARFNR